MTSCPPHEYVPSGSGSVCNKCDKRSDPPSLPATTGSSTLSIDFNNHSLSLIFIYPSSINNVFDFIENSSYCNCIKSIIDAAESNNSDNKIKDDNMGKKLSFKHLSFARSNVMYSFEGRSGSGKSLNAVKVVKYFIASNNGCFGIFANVNTNFGHHAVDDSKENGYKKLSQLVGNSFINNLNGSNLLIDPSLNFNGFEQFKIIVTEMSTKNNIKTLLIILDEFHSNVNVCRTILRAIMDWNTQDFEFKIIPIVTGTASFELDRDGFYSTSLWKKQSLSFAFSREFYDTFIQLIRRKFPKLFDNDLFENLLHHVSIWPIALSNLFIRLINMEDVNAPLSIELAKELFEYVVLKIGSVYSLASWQSCFGTCEAGLINLMILAFTKQKVESNFRINGITLKNALLSGLISLDNVPNSDLVTVNIAEILLVTLNKLISRPVLPYNLLDPYDTDWRTFEDIAVYSLNLHVIALKLVGKSECSISDLRPGACMSLATAEIKVLLPEVNFSIPTFAAHLENKISGILKTGYFGITEIDADKGFIIKCAIDQPKIDYLAKFVSATNPNHYVVILAQQKSKRLVNPQTALPPITSSFKPVTISGLVTANSNTTFITEWISDRDLTSYASMPFLIVASKSNYFNLSPLFFYRKCLSEIIDKLFNVSIKSAISQPMKYYATLKGGCYHLLDTCKKRYLKEIGIEIVLQRRLLPCLDCCRENNIDSINVDDLASSEDEV